MVTGVDLNQPTRKANRRGQGSKLRSEILDAAAELLARSSSAQAVTLRAIARQVGIAAPSIYLHFTDRDAILDAVVSAAFADLAAAMLQSSGTEVAPGQQVRSRCEAYLDYAARFPGRYRVLFERSGPNLSADARSYPAGLAVFELLSSALAAAVRSGTSDSTDPAADSAALWTALHGLATLPPATPGFPWAPTAQLLDQLVTGLARLKEPGSGRPATPALP